MAYSTLLRERRKALHRLIAVAIEELYPDQLAAHYEVLAYHYTEGEAWDKALDYLIKAGEKAVAAYANRDALEYYTRALEICDKLGDVALTTAVEILRRRGFVYWLVADEPAAIIADFDRMLEIARKVADRRLEGLALAFRGDVEFLWLHNLEMAEHIFKTALDIAGDKFEDVRLLASIKLANLYLVFNRHAEARVLLQIAEDLAPHVDDPFILGWWGFVGNALPIWEGRFGDALQFVARWQDITLKVSNANNYLVFYNRQWLEALARGGKGEYEQALALLKEMLTIEERISGHKSVRDLNTVGWIYGELQDYQQAITWNKQAVETAQALGLSNPEAESNARLNLADNLLALGQLDEAEAHLQHVEQIVRNPWPEAQWMLWRYSQHLFHSYGELWLRRSAPEKALSYADECLALAEQSYSQKNVVKGHRLRGQALLAQGKLDEAEQELSVALEVAQRVGNPPQLWKTYAALGDLQQAQRRPNEAHGAYAEALVVIDEMATSLKDQSLKDTFLDSSSVQAIRQKAGQKYEHRKTDS